LTFTAPTLRSALPAPGPGPAALLAKPVPTAIPSIPIFTPAAEPHRALAALSLSDLGSNDFVRPNLSPEQLNAQARAAFDNAALGPARADAEDPATADFKKEILFALLKSPGDPAKTESEVIAILARAHAAGRLEAVLLSVVSDPRIQPLLPPMPEDKRQAYASQFAFMLGAELEGAGRIPGVKPFEPWDAMSQRHLALVKASAYSPRGPGQASLFTESGFIREFETLTGSAFSNANQVKALVDGPASFAVRFALMRKAKKSIHIQSWAFYDDVTGTAAADLLIAKKREGLDVKVIVDGKTVRSHGAGVLKRMQDAGIEVILFQDPQRIYDGLHMKVLLVDGRYAVAGGMNFGDEYSHLGQAPKWRDTDFLYLGPVVADTASSFRGFWDAQLRSQGRPWPPMRQDPAPPMGRGTARASFLTQSPAGEASIFLAYLKAMNAAARSINIENAYFINVPALRQALLDALARGVSVNILTNSAESVDEPIVSAPILESLPELIRAGAKVGLKQGPTLHSKFMSVDGIFSIIGSFNLHPRSIRYEWEVVLNVLDPRFASELDRAFRLDADRALSVPDAAALKIPDSPLTRLVKRLLFNQL
jgi:cardiolipin synthase